MSLLKKCKKYGFIYIMITPVILYFLIFSYTPLIMGFFQSFQENKLLGDIGWVGFDNYIEVLNDDSFRKSLLNGLIINLGVMAGSIFFAIVVAMGLNEIKNPLTKTTIQTTSYLPYLFSWTVVGGMWVLILSPTGLVNGILEFFSFERVHFMTNPDYARWIMIFTGVWKSIGFYTVLILAAIVGINPNLFEAAQIDGASRFKQLRKIVVPEIIPTVKVLVIIAMMGLFTNFDQILVMGNPAILENIRTPMFYVYENGILRFNMGLATAAAVIVLILTMVVTAVVSKLLSGRWKSV